MKRGQVTIFIIVGIIIVFALVSGAYLTSKIKIGVLKEQAEDIITKSFRKEALRIFVNDCLQDELENGLLLLSKQGGRLWDTQPGGSIEFNSNNGIQVGPNEGDQIHFALVDETYPADQKHAYPCSSSTDNPFFCKYTYPDSRIGFGETRLRLSSIEKDLERYLADRVRECVTEYTKSEIAGTAAIEDTEIKMELDFFNDGVGVAVEYPLKFQIEGQEIFHLSNFDFFYGTPFKQLLDSAILFPLEKDQRYVEFPYQQDILLNDLFEYGSTRNFGELRCKGNSPPYLCNQTVGSIRYKDLNVNMRRENLTNGDSILTFTPPVGTVLQSPSNYFFRIARQNRPPALSYVNRLACPQGNKPYDYLVIKDSTKEVDGEKLKELNIKLNVTDPDEDDSSTLDIEINGVAFQGLPPFSKADSTPRGDNQYIVRDWQGLPPDIYNLRAKVTDQYGKSDYQDIRIAFDRPINLDLRIESPFNDYDYTGTNPGEYIVSREDPFFLVMDIPADSVSGFSQEAYYTLPRRATQRISNVQNNRLCLNFPSSGGTNLNCDITDYPDSDDVGGINNPSKFPTNLLSDSNLQLGDKITLDFSIDYCNNLPYPDSREITLRFKKCIPHENENHPYAAPYHEWYLDAAGDLKDGNSNPDPNPLASPFLATHSCCAAGGRIENTNKECFQSPPGCYGKLTGVPADYILEEDFANCDGILGNYCGGTLTSRLSNGELRCGSGSTCSNVHIKCEDKRAWSIVTHGTETGFCHGTMGCSKFTPLTSITTSRPLSIPRAKRATYLTVGDNFNINGYIKDIILASGNPPTSDSQLQLKTICTSNGDPCDGNGDLSFTGTCSGNVCT